MPAHTMLLSYFTSDSSFPFFIQYGAHKDSLYLHSHADFSELTIVLEGHASHLVGKEKYTIQKGDVFIISNDTLHGYDDVSDFKICNIMFQQEQIFDKSSDIWNLEGFHALFVIEPYLARDHHFQSRLRLTPSDFQALLPMLEQMIQEYQEKKAGWKTFLQSHFHLLALKLSRTYQIGHDCENDILLQLLQPISYIEKNYMNTISVESLAKLAGLSSRQLTRLFQKAYQSSPGNYLLHFRLQKSQNLLQHTSHSISDIAYQCGFNDSNYFSRQFHKYMGCPPSQYRAENTSIQASSYSNNF